MTSWLFDFTLYPNGTELNDVVDTTETKPIVAVELAPEQLVINSLKLDVVTVAQTLVTIDTGTPTHRMTVVFAVAAASNNMVCAVNVIDLGNGYFAKYDNLVLTGGVGPQVWQRVSFGFTQLAEVAGTFANGDSFGLEFNHTTGLLTAFKNDVAITGLIDIEPLDALAPSNLVGFHGRSQGVTGLLSAFIASSEADAQAISDVNGDNIVAAGSLGNEANVVGFSELITEGDIEGLELEVLDNEDGTVTLDVPDPVHGDAYPAVSYYDEDAAAIIDVIHDLTLSGATQTATRAITFNPLAQYSVVLCRDPELVDPTFLGPNLEDVPVDGADLFWSITADGQLTGRGRITTDEPKTTIYGHWIESTGIMKIYSFVINEAGIVDRYPIVALAITAEVIMGLAFEADTI